MHNNNIDLLDLGTAQVVLKRKIQYIKRKAGSNLRGGGKIVVIFNCPLKENIIQYKNIYLCTCVETTIFNNKFTITIQNTG